MTCLFLNSVECKHLRISERRLNKLRLYSVWKDKTMTQILEDFIDSLPTPEIGNSSSTNMQEWTVFTFSRWSIPQSQAPFIPTRSLSTGTVWGFCRKTANKKRPASHSWSLKCFNVVFSKELIPIARSQNLTSNLSLQYCSSQHSFFIAI